MEKQASQNVVTPLHRNDDLIYEIYTHGIQEMFELLQTSINNFMTCLINQSVLHTRTVTEEKELNG